MGDLQKVLADNLNRLMDDAAQKGRLDLATPVALEHKTKNRVGKSTIYRICNRQVNARLDNLEDLARVFGLEAWMLLAPALEPGTKLLALSEAELDRRVQARAEELVQETMKQLTTPPKHGPLGSRLNRRLTDSKVPDQGSLEPAGKVPKAKTHD